MMGLNNFGATITVLTAVTLTALAIEILYVLWKHRKSHRSRVCVRAEPQENSVSYSSSSNDELENELETQVEKWQYLYGPSRVLFTIKEEEREGVESENGSSTTECSSVVTVKKAMAVSNTRLSENVVVNDEFVVAVEELLDETTPYSTPCDTSPYYTPQSSPTRRIG